MFVLTNRHHEIQVPFVVFIFTGCVLSLVLAADTHPDRVQDELFRESTELLGRNVTCDNTSDGVYKFPSRTWSCYNIRVDGIRILTQMFSSADSKSSFDCADDVEGRNDLGALCRHLLKAHDIYRDLWAALVVRNAACVNPDDPRITFEAYDESYEEGEQYFHWVTLPRGRGSIQTLRCMVEQ